MLAWLLLRTLNGRIGASLVESLVLNCWAINLAALASAVVLSGTALAAFSPPARLVVVSDDSYPPYLFRTGAGKLQGIIPDKWELWSRKTGVPVTVEGM